MSSESHEAPTVGARALPVGILEEGIAHHERGEHARALAIYERILAHDSTHPDALRLLGVIMAQTGELARGLQLLDKALAVAPTTTAVVLDNRGSVLQRLNRDGEALDSYDRAIGIDPSYPPVHFNRGVLLQKLRQFGAALAAFERYIALAPGVARAHYQRGNVLRDLKQLDAAVASYDQALLLKPDYADASLNRGNVLRDLGRLDAALESYDRAIAIDPNCAEAHSNRGVVLSELQRSEEALASLDRAIALKPDYAEARCNRAYLLLARGDYPSGWADHEWRWKVRSSFLYKQNEGLPGAPWLGAESIAGKVLLLHEEQGFGDVIQFCRYATLAAEAGATVILAVRPELKAMMSSLAGVSRVVSAGEVLPPCDYRCPLMSLPLAFRTTVWDVPARVPYLKADPHRAQYWKDRLGAREALRVGLVWSGGFRPNRPELWPVNGRRNIPLSSLADLKHPGAQFFSLQKGQPAESELTDLIARGWCGPHLIDFTAQLNDFSDTAALIENLDLVIAVDTATAHLAGALGKAVWILNRFDACWRWLSDRTGSPWYPTARLYRQDAPGDWRGVVARVGADLRRMIESGGATGGRGLTQ